MNFFAATGQLHPLGEAAAGRSDADRGWGGEQLVHLGPGVAHAAHQGRADLFGAGVLRARHQSRLEGVLQLLQRRQHCRLGPAEPDAGAPVPGTHGRR